MKRKPEIINDGYMRRVSTCCGRIGSMVNDDASWEDYGICPECREHCDYEYPEPDPDNLRDWKEDRKNS